MGIRIGAIDVGSNAVRMCIGELNKSEIEVLENFRVPIRLGEDSFSKGYIDDNNLRELLRAFVQFEKEFSKLKVKKYKAVATSALRDAKNKDRLIDLIYSTSQIKLDIIDGKEEAKLVHLGVSHIEDLSKKRALLIDIGGGSVEFIISNNGRLAKFFSFNMGTVRLIGKLKKSDPIEYKKNIENDVRNFLKPLIKYKKYFQVDNTRKLFIGTGGNIKALNKLSNTLFKGSDKEEVTSFELELLEKILFGFSLEERIQKLDMRADRADVILPAVIMVREVLNEFGFSMIKAPDVGLKDGILIQVARQK